MDEQTLSGPVFFPAALARKRFGNFALAHFCYSMCCFFLSYFLTIGLCSLPSLSWADWLLGVLLFGIIPLALMGGYALLGYWFGGKDVWPLPLRGRDLARSVLAEAAVAWSWAALVIGLMAADNEGFLLMPVFFPSIFLALPSSVFVISGVGMLRLFGGLADWMCMGFLAGLLPPLLFNLGSYWRTHRAMG